MGLRASIEGSCQRDRHWSTTCVLREPRPLDFKGSSATAPDDFLRATYARAIQSLAVRFVLPGSNPVHQCRAGAFPVYPARPGNQQGLVPTVRSPVPTLGVRIAGVTVDDRKHPGGANVRMADPHHLLRRARRGTAKVS